MDTINFHENKEFFRNLLKEIALFDKNTGAIWYYSYNGKPRGKLTIQSLGAPLKETDL